jgi:hypothetical protein
MPTDGRTDAEVMRVYWPLTIGVTESRLTDMTWQPSAAAEWCRGRASERQQRAGCIERFVTDRLGYR